MYNLILTTGMDDRFLFRLVDWGTGHGDQLRADYEPADSESDRFKLSLCDTPIPVEIKAVVKRVNLPLFNRIVERCDNCIRPAINKKAAKGSQIYVGQTI